VLGWLRYISIKNVIKSSLIVKTPVVTALIILKSLSFIITLIVIRVRKLLRKATKQIRAKFTRIRFLRIKLIFIRSAVCYTIENVGFGV